MEQSPWWEANVSAASQEIPRILMTWMFIHVHVRFWVFVNGSWHDYVFTVISC
jgi:hypothetical protein